MREKPLSAVEEEEKKRIIILHSEVFYIKYTPPKKLIQ